MAPTLLSQLVESMRRQDSRTFGVLVNTMASACQTTPWSILKSLKAKYFDPADIDIPGNVFVNILIASDLVEGFEFLLFQELTKVGSGLYQLCLQEPDFMSEVLTCYEDGLKLAVEEGKVNLIPADHYKLNRLICHRLLCTDASESIIEAGLVTLSEMTELVNSTIEVILAHQVDYQPGQVARKLDELVFQRLVDLALALESQVWLKSLVLSQCVIQLDYLDRLPQYCYVYMIENSLIPLEALIGLVKTQPKLFLLYWFEAVFNHSTQEQAKWVEGILRESLLALHSVDLRLLLQLDVAALFKYSYSFTKVVIALVLCGKVNLIGTTNTLNNTQINWLWDVADCRGNIKILITDDAMLKLFNKLIVEPQYRDNFNRAISCVNVFSNVFWSRPLYDCIVERLSIQDTVTLFHCLFLNHDSCGPRSIILLKSSDLHIVKKALARFPNHPDWVFILQPGAWDDEGVLDQLYYLTDQKYFFIVYALQRKDRDITREVLIALKKADIANFTGKLLKIILSYVTDLNMLSHASGFIEYLSELDNSNGAAKSKRPRDFLVPELDSFYQA